MGAVSDRHCGRHGNGSETLRDGSPATVDLVSPDAGSPASDSAVLLIIRLFIFKYIPLSIDNYTEQNEID